MLCSGILNVDEIISATAKGPVTQFIGSDTGKDGIQGASFASKDITEERLTIFHQFRLVILSKKNFF